MANQFSNVASAVNLTNNLAKRVPLGLTSALVVAVIGVVLHAMFSSGNPTAAAGVAVTPPATQPVDLKGTWLGMDVSSLNTPAAAAMGIPSTTPGVFVVELREATGWRATQAGIMTGDVITAVEGQKVKDLASLSRLALKVDVSKPVMIEVMRWGQPVTLILPAPQQAFAMAPQMMPQMQQMPQQGFAPQAMPQPQMMPQPQLMPPQAVAPQMLPPAAVAPQMLPAPAPAWNGAQAVALNPVAWNGGQPVALNPVALNPVALNPVAWNGAQPVAQAAPAASFFCPRDGCVLPATAVPANFRCPNCNGPLGRIQ